ncbi:MAG TPA: hypothetical protein VL120_16090 [Solirubrobacteraceae bacterium]|nr:hypothetical protein [Solirubrobacteraceae bacterium]
MRRLIVLLSLSILGAVLALPAAAMASGSVSALSINPSLLTGGASAIGTVDLAFPDPGPTVVRLSSTNPSVAQVPFSFTIPAGQTTGTFTLTTTASAPAEIVQIWAWSPDNSLRMYNVSVNPAQPAGNTMTSVSFIPSSIVAGQNATGTVKFSGPMPDGANVQLTSSNPAVAQVPQETVVPANTSSAIFNLSTSSSVTTATTVTITAKWINVTKTTTITVAPGTAPAKDVVKITKASWRRGLLTIEATSTNPNAILSVYSQAGNFMFDLTNRGGGRYTDQRGFITNPIAISVRSNFGGSASAKLTN